MTQLDPQEVLVVLRALYFYEDKLANTAEKYMDTDELEKVSNMRQQMGNQLKFEARID